MTNFDSQKEGWDHVLKHGDPDAFDPYKKYRTNFLPLNRRIGQHWIWQNGEHFRAWIYLLMCAKYTNGTSYHTVNGKPIPYKRGELVASQGYLKRAWSWSSIKKVRTFLKSLKDHDMISTRLELGENVIHITNYHKYNKEQKGAD